MKSKSWSILVLLFYFFAFIVIIKNSIDIHQTNDVWRMGDWLINYQGGFVRRGLLGEFLIQLQALTGISILYFASALHILLYFIYFGYACRLSLGVAPTPINAAVIFSPAFILFALHDELGGFRKEIILFSFLAFCCFSFSKIGKIKITNLFAVLLTLACAVMVLSHEMLVAYLPYLACAFIVGGQSSKPEMSKYVLAIFSAMLVAVPVVLIYRGGPDIVASICSSLGSSAPQDCLDPTIRGAISFLSKDIKFGNYAVTFSNPVPTQAVYGVSFALSLSPLGLYLKWSKAGNFFDRRSCLLLAAFVFMSVVLSLPLLWVVADYGRLIYIHVTCLTLLVLQVENIHGVRHQGAMFSKLAWGLCLVFIAGWRLIHWNATPQRAFLPYAIVNKYFPPPMAMPYKTPNPRAD